MNSNGSYQAKEFNLSGLKGIPDRTLEMRFKLAARAGQSVTRIRRTVDSRTDHFA
jgi:hypothetical protein